MGLAFANVSYADRCDGDILGPDFAQATHSHQRYTASFCPRVVLPCLLVAPMSSGSSSSWLEGWSGTYHGWRDTSAPEPAHHEPAPDELVLNSVHMLQDRLQQTLVLSQRRSHKTCTERATSISKGNAAYAAMEAVIMARAWQDEATRPYDLKFAEATEAEETYHNAIKRTLEKTETLEKHVKTVTLRADSLATTEADFFQTLIERQEEPIRELKILYGQLCQPRPTQR